MKKTIRVMFSVVMAAVAVCALSACFSVAAASVGDAVVSTWQSAAGEMKKVVNGVIVPVLSAICGIGLVVTLAMVGYDYKKHKEMNWVPSILFSIGLVITLVAPPLIWQIAGIA